MLRAFLIDNSNDIAFQNYLRELHEMSTKNLLKWKFCVTVFVSNNFIEMQKSLFRIDKKLHGKTSALNLIYSRMRFCKIVLGVLTYVACDGSLLKRLTLFKFSFQRTVLSVIRQDRKRKKRRARDYFMTAFLWDRKSVV